MKDLKPIIRSEWPESKEDIPVSIREYFSFRDELTLQNGIVFKGKRLVISAIIRNGMLEKTNANHIGIQGCLRRMQEVMYWPNVSRDVEEYILNCDVCNSYPVDQCKGPLICHEITSCTWEKVAVDMFQLDDKHYFIIVDYY